jgi:hypothetical protein
MTPENLNEWKRFFAEAEFGGDISHARFMLWMDAHRHEIGVALEENATLRKQADYAHRMICDWWKPETTSQAVHREYALSALANRN